MPRRRWDSDGQQETHDAFKALYDSFTDAYWAASTMQDKDYIRGLSDFISGILTQLNKQAIESRTKEFEDLTDSVKTISPRLEKAKEKIDQIIQDVQTATAVAKGIDTVLAICIKYFGKM